MEKGNWYDDDVYEDFSIYSEDSNIIKLRDWQRRAKEFFFENDNKAIFEVVTGGGKTFFTIDIIQEILEKKPDTKILVVVPKNVILETGWYKEFVDVGIPIQKIGVYYGNVKEYAQITLTNMQSIHKIPLNIFDMFVADECFKGDTKVTLMDKNRCLTKLTIKDIVEKKIQGPVVSFNIKTKKFELKQITNWYKIPNKKELIKLTFDNNTNIIITPDQELYNGEKYITANEIQKGTKIISFIDKSKSFKNYKTHSFLTCVKKEKIDNSDYVYDIEVKDNHNFIANGLLSHNCHNYGTKRMLEFLKHPFKYKLGLTATLKRMDNKHYEIMKIFNYNIFKYKPEEALNDGVLNPFDFYNIGIRLDSETREKYDNLTQQLNSIFQSGGSYQTIMRTTSPLKFKMLGLINERKSLVNNYHKKFNVARDIINKNKDNKIIVFNQFNDQTSKMYWYLLEDNISCRIVHSGISKEKREQALIDFKNDKFNVLLTSKVLDEGYNLPKLDLAIIMAGDSTDKQTIQRMGRVLRKKKNMNSKLYQIFCIDTIESRNAEERAKIFKRLCSDYLEYEFKSKNRNNTDIIK